MESPESTERQVLDGIRVLDVSTILAGPLACQILGDYGADVIKIEHPKHGDGMRGHGLSKNGVGLWWKMVGRNKRAVGLYLGHPEGQEVFRELVRTADVVVENFRPGTLERWGIGWDVLRELNPGLVLLRVTGFGQDGPYASRAGFGTLAESMSGFAHLTGTPEGPPTLPAFGLADSIAGITGACAVAMALFAREKNGGRGQEIDLNILEPIMTAVGPSVIYADQLGVVQQRTGNRSVNNAPRNTYRTKDDRWVAISTSANSVAERLMTLVGRPEIATEDWFATGAGRVEHVDELDEIVGSWIAERTRDEVSEAFEAAGAAVAPVYAPDELLADPHVVARDMIPAVPDDELGPIRMQNVLFRMSETPGRIRFTGRPIGADTDVVLGEELGLSSARLAKLRDEGVVR